MGLTNVDILGILGGIDSDANMQLADPSLVRYYKNLKNRIIYVDTELDDNTLEYQRMILQFNIDDKDIPVENRKPIKLLINSPGGLLTETMSLARTIKLSKTPVYTYNMGEACSGAFLLLISGDKRFALPGTFALYHRGSGAVGGDFDDTVSATKQYKEQIGQMQEWVVKNTSLTKSTLTRKKSANWWMDDKEQLDNHVVDKIIESIDEIVN